MELVITGMGAVCCLGTSWPEAWSRLLAGESGLGSSADAAQRARGWLTGPAPALADAPTEGRARVAWLAARAAAEALAGAGLDALERPSRWALLIGSSLAGSASSPGFWSSFASAGPAGADYRALISYDAEPLLASLADRFGLRGPSALVNNACAASVGAIARAGDLLRAGRVDGALVIGVDPLDDHTVAGFGVIGALSSQGGLRPLSEDRDGMALSDGFAALVIEPGELAAARGRRGLVRLAGYGESADAYHRTQPHPEGAGAALAMERALAMAGLSPDAIDLVNLHATATPANDGAEVAALRRVFGARLAALPLSASKPALGHTLGAAGALETLVTAQALIDQRRPPTLGLDEPLASEHADLKLDRWATAGALRAAMSNSFGFGGANGSVVLEVIDG